MRRLEKYSSFIRIRNPLPKIGMREMRRISGELITDSERSFVWDEKYQHFLNYSEQLREAALGPGADS